MELLTKRPTLLAMVAVVWFIWGGLASEPDAKGKSLDGLPTVEPEDVEVRPGDAPTVAVRNPFPPFNAPEDGGFGGAAPEPEPTDDDAKEPVEVEVKPPEPRILVEHRPGFVLRLDSIMAFGAEGGHARINGATVRLGDIIPGCDPEAPPMLVDLQGLSATIRHRDVDHRLHLDDAPRLEVRGEMIRHVLDPLPVAEDQTHPGESADTDDQAGPGDGASLEAVGSPAGDAFATELDG